MANEGLPIKTVYKSGKVTIHWVDKQKAGHKFMNLQAEQANVESCSLINTVEALRIELQNKNPDKTVVDITFIQWLKKELLEINKLELKEIIFFEGGLEIEIDEAILESFTFTGLNNTDLITSGYYKDTEKDRNL